MVDLLSIKEISQKLGIPQSTLRYYRDIFMDYLPSSGEGKKKRFFPEAIDVFAAIAKGMQQNKNAEEIAAELDTKFARFIEVNSNTDAEQTQDDGATYPQNDEMNEPHALASILPQDNATILAVVAKQNQAMQQIAATVSMINAQQEELHTLKDEISKWEERFENQLTEHYQLVDNRLRQIMEAKRSGSIWQRWFGKIYFTR
ncbi:MAG TPA: MerR family transcriptional regulator [Methylomusa anaerophila]|uniref:HTH merR-type domain-containing protein n=1 Tax=Methylomusa anaerophila TaxID=1930071 RepID=A0A348AF62_9FIRM|nr:MerR family transcriptional regulator [Methylomusa anaerophila]BBB89710.1 hypothetical protein MAMMFC1_00343 [Methylomusa anaerophila]HML89245.1 MerR family transcriptional regulator [Methylomusa anaerophila]